MLPIINRLYFGIKQNIIDMNASLMSLDANSCAYVALYRWSVRSLAGGGQASPWRSLIAVGLTAGARRGIRPDMPRLFRVDNRAARFNPSNVEPRR